MAVGSGKYRDIVVLRHTAGSRYLYVYCANNSTATSTAHLYGTTVTKTNLLRSNITQTSEPLTFGAVHYLDGFRNYGKGHIHWCKIWYDDLGDDVAKKIAIWPHETIRMEYWGAGKYYYYNSSEVCKASWIANNAIGTGISRDYYMYNTDSTNINWSNSMLRTFYNNRVFEALPITW